MNRSFYNTDPLFYLSSFFPKGNPRCDNTQRGFSYYFLLAPLPEQSRALNGVGFPHGVRHYLIIGAKLYQ